MKQRLAALTSVAVALSLSRAVLAQEVEGIPGHPWNSSQRAANAADVDPFSFAVPILDRDIPAPSYAQPSTAESPAQPAGMDKSMENMDHSNMPGMTEGTN